MNLLNYKIIAIILSFLLTNASGFIPSKRYGHTANYNDTENKIYFFGGALDDDSISVDFFTLEVKSLKFEQQQIISNPPEVVFATSVINNSKIYVYKGRDGTTLYQGFFSIDISNEISSWKSLDRLMYNPTTVNAIIDSSGKIYVFAIFAQQTFSKSLPPDCKMFVYDTYRKSWNPLDPITNEDFDRSKLPVSGFTATYLPNSNSIIYIGGKSFNGNLIPMNQIWIYSISDNKLKMSWIYSISDNKLTMTDTNNIDGRYGHSACLVQNKVIIYGGLSTQPLNSNNALAILDINDDEIYSWSTHKIPNNQTIPYYHTATTINDAYMLVAFGKDIVDTISYANLFEGDQIKPWKKNHIEDKLAISTGESVSNTSFISILKVEDYTWVSSLNEETGSKSTKELPNSNMPGSTQFSGSNSTSPKSKANVGSIVGGVIGGILGVILLAGLVFFFYRRNNTKRHRNSESFHELTASTMQNSTQQSLISNSQSLPSFPWESPLKPNPSIQPLQAEQSAPNSRPLPSIPWVNPNTSTQPLQAEQSVPNSRSLPWVNPNISAQPLQAEQSALVMLIPPLTNLNMSELSSVESRQPLDSSSSGPSLLSIPLVSSNPFSPFYDE
ncbi:5362_t:CDS:2 [Ambispora gerdemannii]|uniref:5362_t:CDS:1 n=1 Tax=Ambispora gerdemannii TaxID=144530 RepID=A0A9N9FF73_9GLOM|nr:5362_t:CDS:2 [Ambispora gerdemannii]